MKPFTPHELYLLVACNCGAKSMDACAGIANGVHFGRRLRRMLTGLRAVSEQQK